MGSATVLTPLELLALVKHAEDEGQRRRLLRDHRAVSTSEEFFLLLHAEAERYHNDSPPIVQRLAEALLYAADLAGRPDQRALGLLKAGDALRFLGRYREAVDHFEEGGRLLRELGDEVGWARSHIGLVWSLLHLGRGEEALAAAGRPHEILVAHGVWLRAGFLDMSAGYVCRHMGRYEQALELYRRAESEFSRVGAAGELWLASAKQHRAQLLNSQGDFRAALALNQEARDVFVRLEQAMGVLQLDREIAYGYAGQGDYTRALRIYGDVFAAQERAGLDADAAWVALAMVECYLRLNRHADALDLAQDAAGRFERLGAPTEAAKARLLSALAYARLGELDPALALLGEAATAFASAGLSGQIGIATLLRASLLLEEEDWPGALAEAERAHGLFAERGLAVQQAQSQLIRARALLGLGRLAEAAGLARSALAISRSLDVPWLAHEGHHTLAGVARAGGDLHQALAGCEAAIDGIEREQSRLVTELRTNFLEDKLQIYHDAVDWSLHLGDPERAFDFLERAKSRALVDYLAANPAVRARGAPSGDRKLTDELIRLREEHAWLYHRLYGLRLAQRPEDERQDDDPERLHAEIRARERRIARLLERIAVHDGDGGGQAPAPQAGRRPPRPALDERTVLVEYYFGRRGGGAFVLREGRLTFEPLEVTRGDLTRLLTLWRLNLDATEEALGARELFPALDRNARGLLEALYAALVRPLARHLAGRQRLIAVPYGPLHWVPFHALYDGRRYLLESLEVSVCPSSSLLRLCAARRRPAHSALVLGFGDEGRLPYAADEAHAIAALLPGELYVGAAATRGRVIEAAPRHGVLHLAAHGEARLDNPTFAHVKLADGQLGAVDVFNLELDGALVTLSACETGRTVVTGGDELVGLSRGFLFAGASTLVQSLWRVEDGSTSRLMERFYRALRAGQTKGGALREAQLAALAEHTHPYLWAPFQLVGDGGQL